jgi:hypothetical protein
MTDAQLRAIITAILQIGDEIAGAVIDSRPERRHGYPYDTIEEAAERAEILIDVTSEPIKRHT